MEVGKSVMLFRNIFLILDIVSRYLYNPKLTNRNKRSDFSQFADSVRKLLSISHLSLSLPNKSLKFTRTIPKLMQMLILPRCRTI